MAPGAASAGRRPSDVPCAESRRLQGPAAGVTGADPSLEVPAEGGGRAAELAPRPGRKRPCGPIERRARPPPSVRRSSPAAAGSDEGGEDDRDGRSPDRRGEESNLSAFAFNRVVLTGIRCRAIRIVRDDESDETKHSTDPRIGSAPPALPLSYGPIGEPGGIRTRDLVGDSDVVPSAFVTDDPDRVVPGDECG